MKKVKKVSKIEKKEEVKKPMKKIKKILEDVKEVVPEKVEKPMKKVKKTKKLKDESSASVMARDPKNVSREVSKIEKTPEVIAGKKDVKPSCNKNTHIEGDVLFFNNLEFELETIDGELYISNDGLLKDMSPEKQGRMRTSKTFNNKVRILSKEEFEKDENWVPKCEYIYTTSSFPSIIDEAKYYGNYCKRPCGVYLQRVGVARICVKAI